MLQLTGGVGELGPFARCQPFHAPQCRAVWLGVTSRARCSQYHQARPGASPMRVAADVHRGSDARLKTIEQQKRRLCEEL
jgi:hypothetical protein